MPIEITGEFTHHHRVSGTDYLIIGSPGKGGEMRVTGDASNYDAMLKKAQNLLRLRNYVDNVNRGDIALPKAEVRDDGRKAEDTKH
jgi:hypothetical protein